MSETIDEKQARLKRAFEVDLALEKETKERERLIEEANRADERVFRIEKMKVEAEYETERRELELDAQVSTRTAVWRFYGRLVFAAALIIATTIVSCTTYNIEYLRTVKPQVVPQYTWPRASRTGDN